MFGYVYVKESQNYHGDALTQKWTIEASNGYITEKSNKVLGVEHNDTLLNGWSLNGQSVYLQTKKSNRNSSLEVGQKWSKVEVDSDGWMMIFLNDFYPMSFLTANSGQSNHLTIESNAWSICQDKIIFFQDKKFCPNLKKYVFAREMDGNDDLAMDTTFP